MTDVLSSFFSIVNSAIMGCGIVVVLYGQYYFKEGLMVKTFRRALPVSIVLFIHFFLDMLSEFSILALPYIVGDFLEFIFTIGLAYVLYALVDDWKKIGQ